MQKLQLPSKQWGLIISAAISLGSYLGMVTLHIRQGTLRDWHTAHTLGWYALAFAGYLAALVWVEKKQSARLALIWGAAIGFRVLLLFTTPTLSDDVYRYMWDGYVATNGVNPYAFPINAPELDYLDTPQRALANNQQMASPYPPAAQLLFATLMALFPKSPLVFQIAMTIFDLLAALLIAKLLALTKQPAYRILIYLWNPLVVVETAHGAHLDALMVCLSMLALWLTFSPKQSRTRFWPAPAALALATLTKILPLFLLAVLFWRWTWRQLILYGLIIIALMLPFGLTAGWGLTGPLDGTGLFGAVRIYADQWNFNSGLFHWLENDWLPALGIVDPLNTAKRIVGLMMLATLLVVWLAARRQHTTLAALRLASVPYMAYMVLTTTVHPWYMLILLALVPFLAPQPGEPRWRWLVVAPWLYLSATLALSYITYLNPLDFREFEWIRQTEWWPALALALIGLGWYGLRRM